MTGPYKVHVLDWVAYYHCDNPGVDHGDGVVYP